MEIKYVNGHFEVFRSGEFVSSADTWDEAIDEVEAESTH